MAGRSSLLLGSPEPPRRAEKEQGGEAAKEGWKKREEGGRKTRHDPAYQAFMAERAALGPVLLEVRSALQRILDLGARREDGLARLAAAAGASPVASAGAGQGEAGE